MDDRRGAQPAELDRDVRIAVYEFTLQRGRPPLTAELAERFGDQVGEILQRLHDGRELVLSDGDILMAGPFSAVPTSFHVTTRAYVCYANCIWDALGVAAMLETDVEIRTSCGDCGAAERIDVRGDAVQGQGFMHFPLPPRTWWQDIVFT